MLFFPLINDQKIVLENKLQKLFEIVSIIDQLINSSHLHKQQTSLTHLQHNAALNMWKFLSAVVVLNLLTPFKMNQKPRKHARSL